MQSPKVWMQTAMCVAGLLACGDDETKYVIEPDCNPLASEWHCTLPYPSDVFLTADASTATGKHVSIPDKALPTSSYWGSLDPSRRVVNVLRPYNPDGFGVAPQILAYIPYDIDITPLPAHDIDPGVSLTAQSATVLLRADTGERVVHFAELDARAPLGKRALIIRPMVRLREQTRYIVGIFGLKEKSGKVIPAPGGFSRLRDGDTEGYPALEALASRYENDIFPILTQAGVNRSELQLAWDFTTASSRYLTDDMIRVRNLVVDQAKNTAPAVSNVTVVENPENLSNIARVVRGDIEVPLFLENTAPQARLMRDDTGAVQQNGSIKVPFVMMIPQSSITAAQNGTKSRVAIYAHGFFNDRNEMMTPGWGDVYADTHQTVLVALDWLGMAYEDENAVGIALLFNGSDALLFVDRVHQGIANNLALTYALKDTLAQVAQVQVNDEPVYDAQDIVLIGISQGHMLGSTFFALSPHISKAALFVGGGPFAMVMMRSSKFNALLETLGSGDRLPDFTDQQFFVSMGALAFERIDPITHAIFTFEAPLADVPEKQVLMHMGFSDTAVTNLATQMHARVLGLAVLAPTAQDAYGLTTTEGPLDSALVQVEFDNLSTIPSREALLPAQDNIVHESVFGDAAVQARVERFLLPGGTITH